MQSVPSAPPVSGTKVFAVIVVGAQVAVLAVSATLGLALDVRSLIAWGALYVIAGTAGFAWLRRRSRFGWSLPYFAAQIAIGVHIRSLVPAGPAPLILLPLAGQAVLVLPRAWAWLVCGGIALALPLDAPVPALSAIDLALSVTFVSFVMVYTSLAVREQRLRLEIERLAARAEGLAAARERARIARDIHDTLGHALTASAVHLEAAFGLVRVEPSRAETAIDTSRRLVREGLSALRLAVTALREDAVEESLTGSLERLAADVSDDRLRVDLSVVDLANDVPSAVVRVLYHCAQEALTNVRRHSEATVAAVTVASLPDRVRLTVEDNGGGARTYREGFGLRGMRERIGELGGAIECDADGGRGFRVTMSVPR